MLWSHLEIGCAVGAVVFMIPLSYRDYQKKKERDELKRTKQEIKKQVEEISRHSTEQGHDLNAPEDPEFDAQRNEDFFATLSPEEVIPTGWFVRHARVLPHPAASQTEGAHNGRSM